MNNYTGSPSYTAQPFPGVHHHHHYSSCQVTAPLMYRRLPSYGATTTHMTAMLRPNPNIIIVGECPVCRAGVVKSHFTSLGVLIAILLFPLGILCCFLFKEKTCSNCKAAFA